MIDFKEIALNTLTGLYWITILTIVVVVLVIGFFILGRTAYFIAG